jgi:site-specific DNA-methyltransferase (adenine-specific)
VLRSSLCAESAALVAGFFTPDAPTRWDLVLGDSLGLLLHVPSESVDAMVTDSPYSSGGAFRGDRAARTGDKYIRSDVHKQDEAADRFHDFEGDTRDQLSFRHWVGLWSAECWRAAKPGAIGGLWTDWRQVGATIEAFQIGGWVYRGLWVWDKTEGVRPMKGRPRNQCELVVWGSKGPMSETRCGGVVEPGCVRVASTSKTKRGHQTGKPNEANRLWARLCEPGGTLLDPFAGSASMADAVLDEGQGRRYLGFEVVPRLYDDARARLEARTLGGMGDGMGHGRRKDDGQQLTLGSVA